MTTGIEKMVAEDIAKRQQLGIAKYGTTVIDNPLTRLQWTRHAYEEALDLAIYLRRLIHEIETNERDTFRKKENLNDDVRLVYGFCFVGFVAVIATLWFVLYL